MHAAPSSQSSSQPVVQVEDLHIAGVEPISSPREVQERWPLTEDRRRTVIESRQVVQDILAGKDKRLLVLVGPCSIHDVDAAMEYAERLAKLQRKLSSTLYIMMRVYFEKPRTTVGWKGLINDPHLNNTFDIQTGLYRARKLLSDVVGLGLPAGTEFLDPITPQYIADLVTWAAIGARTTESQTHRQMASGLSMPVGYKNRTDGSLQIAFDAMKSARSPHSFLGIDHEGKTAIIKTRGNRHGHLILRGGADEANFDKVSVAAAVRRLEEANLPRGVMVDCSHANSQKDYARQAIAWNDCIDQRAAGNEDIIGLMVESNLFEGNQKLGDDLTQLKRGVSVTDACIGWDTTVELFESAARTLSR